MTNKPQPKEPRLLDRVRTEIRLRGMSYRTENSYVDWIRRFIIFNGKRHPNEMGPAEIKDFLAWLVNERNVAASTQNQALHAILFLYREGAWHRVAGPGPLAAGEETSTAADGLHTG